LSNDTIAQMMMEQRKEKDHWLRDSPHSPLPYDDRINFRGLNYFPYDAKFRVEAKLHRHPNPGRITMPTSIGTQDVFLRYGYFEFQLQEKTYTLQVYKSSHGESLFVPFRDGTTGKESYGAGRYLDVEERSSDTYTIDFNLAYNPYCAYSDSYSCPLPPRENWLSVEIRAGEKNYTREDK